MSIRDEIPVDKDSLPEQFEFDFGEESFLLGVNYNEREDFFTLDIFTVDEEPIVLGERLILNQPLWTGITNPLLPVEDIVPMDEAGKETAITFENFGDTVSLYIDDLAPDELDASGGGGNEV